MCAKEPSGQREPRNWAATRVRSPSPDCAPSRAPPSDGRWIGHRRRCCCPRAAHDLNRQRIRRRKVQNSPIWLIAATEPWVATSEQAVLRALHSGGWWTSRNRHVGTGHIMPADGSPRPGGAVCRGWPLGPSHLLDDEMACVADDSGRANTSVPGPACDSLAATVPVR